MPPECSACEQRITSAGWPDSKQHATSCSLPSRLDEPVDGTGSTGPQHFILAEHSDDDDDAEIAPHPFKDILCECCKPLSGTQKLSRFIFLILGSLCLLACGAWYGISIARKQHLDVTSLPTAHLKAKPPHEASCMIASDSNRSKSTTENCSRIGTRTSFIDRNSTDVDDSSNEQGGLTHRDSIYPDLTCLATKRIEWLAVRTLTQEWFGTWEAGVVAREKSWLQGLLDIFISRLKSFVQESQEECGMGHLCMTLLAISSAEYGTTLKIAPTFHSPLLTILLDIPWSIVMRSGWPLFGLLAQLQMQHHKDVDAPMSGHSKQYLLSLNEALSKNNTRLVIGLGVEFVQIQDAVEQADHSGSAHAQVMPALCALASQLLGFGYSPGGVGDSGDNALGQMQEFFRQSVRNIDDLQSTLDSTWPLYGILSQVSVIFAKAL